jgi:drug/metabolite transporter (DMT)-like permease
MSDPTASNSFSTNRLPGRPYLLLAIIIFAAANSVTRQLTELGEQNLVDGRNPISFCNVLFVGNLCALLALILIYRQQWNVQSLQQLSWTDWLGLVGVALLSGALAPALVFMGLDLTAVNNVVLIGRLEPPLTLALSVLLLGERVNRWVVAGAIVSFVGVVVTITLQPPGANSVAMGGFQVGKGELLVALSAVALAVSTVISKVKLRQIPLGIFTVFRTALGTLVFFAAAIQFYGAIHFREAFSPLLWQWMLLYGLVIVVVGQLSWFTGLKRSSASEVSLASSFSPIAGILAAFLILGEAPTLAQYTGGGVILTGIALNQIGVLRTNTSIPTVSQVKSDKEMDMDVGFKGV